MRLASGIRACILMLVVLASCFFTACVGTKPASPLASDEPLAAPLDSLRAKMSLTLLDGNGKNRNLDAVLFSVPGKRYRMEITGPLGIGVASLLWQEEGWKMTFPTIPSRVHPDTTGAVTGIDVWQPNAGWPLAYYAWNGAKWVRLRGATAKLGEPVELLGVIDFAIRGGTMTWYADGVELTDDDGNWAIPMSLSRKQIQSFRFDSGTATLDSLAGDYDLGFNGSLMLLR